MPEFSLKNFDEFVTQVKDIKTELAGDKIKAEKKEKRENREQL